MFGWGTLGAVKMAVRGAFLVAVRCDLGTYPVSALALVGTG
jgi:hypothetical protein